MGIWARGSRSLPRRNGIVGSVQYQHRALDPRRGDRIDRLRIGDMEHGERSELASLAGQLEQDTAAKTETDPRMAK